MANWSTAVFDCDANLLADFYSMASQFDGQGVFVNFLQKINAKRIGYRERTADDTLRKFGENSVICVNLRASVAKKEVP